MGYIMCFRIFKGKKMRSVLTFLIGIFLGYLITKLSSQLQLCHSLKIQFEVINKTEELLNDEAHPKRLLLIGVFVPSVNVTKAKAIQNTWGKNKLHEIIFFTEKSPTLNRDLPFVVLNNLDMTSPESRLNYFEAFKYIHNHHIKSFKYFMLIQDNSYVLLERLEMVLSSISEQGNQNVVEVNQKNSSILNFLCLNGPRTLLSQSVLKFVYPYFDQCLNRVRVLNIFREMNLGQCIEEILSITCITPEDVVHFMYKTSKTDFSYFLPEDESIFRESLLIYPIQDHLSMYRIHNYAQSLDIKSKETAILRVQREISRFLIHLENANVTIENFTYLDDSFEGIYIDHLGYDIDTRRKFKFGDVEEELGVTENETIWNSIQNKWYYIGKEEHDFQYDRQDDISRVKETLHFAEKVAIEHVNRKFKGKSTFVKKYLVYSYFRYCPYYGIQFILDLTLADAQNAGEKVYRKHTYVQIPFGPLYVKETKLVGDANSEDEILLHNNHLDAWETDWEKKTTEDIQNHSNAKATKEVPEDIHMILALSGRFKTFERFMDDYTREVILKNENVAFNIVLYGPDDDAREKVSKLTSEVQAKFPSSRIIIIQGPTSDSKSRALEQGISLRSLNDLIFFIDVDVTFTSKTFDRIRWFTIQGRQVFYPIVFSEFLPTLARMAEVGGNYEHFLFDQHLGHWRRYGYGMVSIYKSDVVKVGGYDTSIIGWGVEDVDLYEKVQKEKSLSILRCPDPGLVHVYHDKLCDIKLDKKRFKMCYNSLFSVFASHKTLRLFVLEHPQVIEDSKKRQEKLNKGRISKNIYSRYNLNKKRKRKSRQGLLLSRLRKKKN